MKIIFSSVNGAEKLPLWKEMLTGLAVSSLCIMSCCNLSYFSYCLGQAFGTDCISSWSLLTFYINKRNVIGIHGSKKYTKIRN